MARRRAFVDGVRVREGGPNRAVRRSGLSSETMVRRLAVVLLVPVMLFAGCSGGDDDVASTTTFAPPLTNPPLPASSTTDEPSDEESTTTSTGPVGSTSPTTAPDPGSSTSSSMVTVTSTPDDTTATTQPDEFDWVAIVQGLSDVLVELQGDPDPERVTEFCLDSENDCQNIQGEAIRQFASEGWVTLNFPRTEVLAAELSATEGDRPISEAAFVVILVSTGPEDFSETRVVDPSGETVFEIDGDGGGGRGQWLLARNDEGAWRVVGIQGLPG